MFFSLAYFLNQLNIKLFLRILTRIDSLRCCQRLIVRYVSVLQDYTTSMMSRNIDCKVDDEIEMVCMSISVAYLNL